MIEQGFKEITQRQFLLRTTKDWKLDNYDHQHLEGTWLIEKDKYFIDSFFRPLHIESMFKKKKKKKKLHIFRNQTPTRIIVTVLIRLVYFHSIWCNKYPGDSKSHQRVQRYLQHQLCSAKSILCGNPYWTANLTHATSQQTNICCLLQTFWLPKDNLYQLFELYLRECSLHSSSSR